MAEPDTPGPWLSEDHERLYWIFPDGVAVPMDGMSDDDWREALVGYRPDSEREEP